MALARERHPNLLKISLQHQLRQIRQARLCLPSKLLLCLAWVTDQQVTASQTDANPAIAPGLGREGESGGAQATTPYTDNAVMLRLSTQL